MATLISKRFHLFGKNAFFPKPKENLPLILRRTLGKMESTSWRKFSASIPGTVKEIPVNLILEDKSALQSPKPSDCYHGFDPPPMNLSVKKFGTNSEVEEITLSNLVFGVPIRRDIVHNVIKWERAKKRCGNARTKRMKDLRGSTRKLRNQKGSGMARVGMNRRAGRVGGMKAHGPVPRDFSFKLNKKVIRLGQRVALSAKLREKAISVVNDLIVPEPKTAIVKKYLKTMKLTGSTLIVDGEHFPYEFLLASNNIPDVKSLKADEINVYDMIKYRNLLLTVDAVKVLQNRLIERAH